VREVGQRTDKQSSSAASLRSPTRARPAACNRTHKVVIAIRYG
jgi:hypothetical protein